MKFTLHRERRFRGAGLSFDEIVRAAKAGDDRAASLLYLDHVPMVYGYLRARGCPDPEDTTSEVFIGMIRGIDGFDGDEPSFRRWLMTIAHRRLVDQWRHDGRNPSELSQPSSFEVLEANHQPDGLSAVEIDPDLAEAFRHLTEAQREVLGLRFVADVSLQDVASITGRPTGAIKSLQNRGLQSLRRQMSMSRAQMRA
jgi:RNA polymerase sigma-70 factor (ECF subfamily)